MNYEKGKYEQLILESPLFDLDRKVEYTAFKRESYRMVEYLYCYLLSINKKEYEPYGCEIAEIATRCISNFDTSKGIFLHYFNAAWKKEYSHILSKQMESSKYRGLHITEEDIRSVRKYIKIAEQIGNHTNPSELYKKLSEAMNLPLERILDLEKLSRTSVCRDSYLDVDGEEQSLWNQLQDCDIVELNIESEEEINIIMARIDRAFCSLQKRQQAIISDMITAKICLFLTADAKRRFSFISESIIEQWSHDGSVPTQREIAEKYGRKESSISRTFKDFLEKIKREG